MPEIFSCETCGHFLPLSETKGKCSLSGKEVSITMSCTKHNRFEKKQKRVYDTFRP